MNGSICLDTSIVIAVLRGDAALKIKLDEIEQICLAAFVLAELIVGARGAVASGQSLVKLEAFVSDCIILYPTRKTLEFYAEVRLDLTRRGMPIPQHDIWIAALCLEHALPLVTRDSHFDAVETLQRIRW